MYDFLKTTLINWNSETNQRVKLQHAYGFAAIVIIILSGLITWMNSELGHKLVVLGIASGVIYIINGIFWALLDAFVAAKLPKKTTKKK